MSPPLRTPKPDPLRFDLGFRLLARYVTMRDVTGPRQVGVGPRAATEAEWRTSSLILDPGEEGVAWDTRVRKIGDGIHTWAALLAPDGEPADLAPILARVEELEDEVEALTSAPTPSPIPPPGDGEDIPDPVVVFENGLL